MEFGQLRAMEVGSGAFPAISEGLVEHTTPERLQRVVDLLEGPGSVVLLVGESGSGKRRLAQDAADALARQMKMPTELITLAGPSNPLSTIATRFGVPATQEHFAVHEAGEVMDDTEQMAEQLLKTVQEAALDPDRGAPVVLLQGIDHFAPRLTCLIDKIVRVPGARIIATAHELSGAAAHLSSNSRAHAVSVAPLTMEQSHRYLNRLLGVESIEYHSLRRWYQATEGNALSVLLLTLALDREGRVGRSRGVAYELPGPDLVPREFWAYLSEICTEEELRTLEVIAQAEPMGESALLRELNPRCLSRLRIRGLLRTQHRGGNGSQLSLSHKLLASAVREQMPAERVSEISGRLFDALREGTPLLDVYRKHTLLVRLVRLGLDADRPLPADWLFEAMEEHSHTVEVRLLLRIARALLIHPDVSTNQFATAALQLVRVARTSGEHSVLDRTWDDVRDAIDRLRRTVGESSMLRVKLELELVGHYAFDLGDAEKALTMVDDLERRLDGEQGPKLEVVQGWRAMLLASTGELRAAESRLPDPEAVDTMPVEWERGTARVVSSLLLGQRGQFTSSLRVADQAASYAVIGEKPQSELANVLQFCSFVNFWICGATEAARYRLALILETAKNDTQFVGFAEIAATLMSLADGKWGLAAQRGERLVDRLSQYDRHGLMGLALSAQSLALAALGEKEESRRSIRAAETHSMGLSQAVAGYVRLLTLRARQWNADDTTAALGLQLAAWARAEQLETVELLALHVVAMEDRSEASHYASRMRSLAASIEPPFSAVVLAHCEDLATGAPAWESPSARALTELGIWMPLPATDELSAREREVALYASLGYSSRWIAEQFHLSVRTVDTHLRHVFTKLRVSGRDELRHWFRREHQTW